jgi:hypothetical protein
MGGARDMTGGGSNRASSLDILERMICSEKEPLLVCPYAHCRM